MALLHIEVNEVFSSVEAGVFELRKHIKKSMDIELANIPPFFIKTIQGELEDRNLSFVFEEGEEVPDWVPALGSVRFQRFPPVRFNQKSAKKGEIFMRKGLFTVVWNGAMVFDMGLLKTSDCLTCIGKMKKRGETHYAGMFIREGEEGIEILREAIKNADRVRIGNFPSEVINALEDVLMEKVEVQIIVPEKKKIHPTIVEKHRIKSFGKVAHVYSTHKGKEGLSGTLALDFQNYGVFFEEGRVVRINTLGYEECPPCMVGQFEKSWWKRAL